MSAVSERESTCWGQVLRETLGSTLWYSLQSLDLESHTVTRSAPKNKFEVWLDKSYFLFPHDNNPLISQVRILYLYWRKWDCPGSRLDWSCDLNPIENLWRELKQIIVGTEAATNLNDIAKKTSRARKIFGRKEEFLSAPTYPMPSRVEAVVVAKGDVTKY